MYLHVILVYLQTRLVQLLAMSAVPLLRLVVCILALVHSVPIALAASSSGDTNYGCEPGERVCSKCYGVLEDELFINDRNRFNLQRAFFPPDTSYPVFVGITYHFTRNASGNCSTDYSLESPSQNWYWTESTFYLFQPTQSLQFTSLLFADSTFRQTNLSLYLQPDCEMASLDMMKLLTQRVRHGVHACSSISLCLHSYGQHAMQSVLSSNPSKMQLPIMYDKAL